VREGNFARLGKIRRMKNGLYLDSFKQVRVTHNLRKNDRIWQPEMCPIAYAIVSTVSPNAKATP